jgi:2'-5' RNA ligase
MDESETAGGFVRAFVAVAVDETVRQALADTQALLRKTRAHVSWVPVENFHVSFAFLGDITTEMAGLVGDALDEAAARVAPFSFRVAQLGTFGSKRRPRVLWAGVHDADPMTALHKRVTELLQGLDLTLESRPFRPHITLGRIRSPRGVDELLEAIHAAEDTAFGHVDAAGIFLMRSVLAPSGARYSVLHDAPLAGAENSPS